ncbi:probable L-type lectin-domain containing receptor kinase S.7 [Humulus lupulus]|uniref:probable L-type lectin-domain containing receptor kinase S.7 n=1 Tax=Humulus lupulus TaxID=3486 RepID=UPI002B406155|nr:probable L-type lectin-domain containing receptor kinase S.7 [Humulus lupulus]
MDSSQLYFFWLIIIFCTISTILIQENQIIIQAHEIAPNHHHYEPPTNVTKTFYFPNFITPTHQLKLLGNATHNQNGVVQIPHSSSSPPVDLTNQVGRVIYSSPIRLFDPLTNTPASFKTTFSFQLNSTGTASTGREKHYAGGGGLAFIIVPDEFTLGRSGPWLGILNDACNHYKAFAVEFDSSHDPELGDPNDDHVGINAGAAVSFKTAVLPSSEARVSLHNSSVHRAWINYDEKNKWIKVFLGLDGDPVPQKPVLSSPLNLSPFLQEYMFVGFSASTGNSSQIHNIFSWNFSSVSQAFVRSRTSKICHRNLARQVSKYSADYNIKSYYDPPSSFMIFVAVLGLFLLGWLCFYLSSQPRKSSTLTTYDISNVFLEKRRRPRPPSKPRRFSVLELSQATRRFSEVEALASDASGVLYRGTMRNGCRLGVKRFKTSCRSQQQHSLSWSGLEYGGRVLKRIGELTQVSHPTLSPIRGWCCDSAETIVVYDYYVNGSVEKWLLMGIGAIPWTRRVKLIKDVGKALSFLHSKELVHANVNASSVFLDVNYEAVLGDYGFVFSPDRGRDRSSTSTFVEKKQDVFKFGMLVLEIVAGRRTVDFDFGHDHGDHEMGILEFALRMEERGEIVKVVDERVMRKNCAGDSEEGVRFVEIGLSCCTSENNRRPSMDDVVRLLN